MVSLDAVLWHLANVLAEEGEVVTTEALTEMVVLDPPSASALPS
jgi:hypothetical protein